MKILQLRAENVKRLGVVEITPNGNVVVIGGKNGAGKTSVLDSIWYALGGKAASPSDPIHHGKETAEVTVTLGNGEVQLQVIRKWTEKGSTLKVKTDEGAPLGSPQSVLDALYGTLTFDPLSFAGMKGADQVNALKELTGLDLEANEKERAAAFATRTEVGRDLRRAEANLAAAPLHEDVPEGEVSVSRLLDDRNDAQCVLDAFTTMEQRLRSANENVVKLRTALAHQEKEIREMEVALAREDRPDIQKYDERIKTAGVIAAMQRDNADYEALRVSFNELDMKHNDLTTVIDTLDAEKSEAIMQAKMPVPGLAFGNGVVLYQDVPFDQCSSAERLRVSVSIGLAMNPKLKVLLIRDGSLLDEDNLQMIATMAEKADAQVWIERVGDGEECSVVIEDGSVRGA